MKKEITKLEEAPVVNPEIEECDNSFSLIISTIRKQDGYIVDIPLLEKAYEQAKTLHGMNRRHSGILYLHHPIAVMKELSHLMCKTSVLAAALLHDTMEDCDYKYEALREDFSPEIADIVAAVTAIKAEEKEADEHFHEMSETDRHDFLDKLTDAKLISSRFQREAFLVRFADRAHNLATLDACDDGRRKRKIESTRAFLIPAARRLGMRYFEVVLRDYCMKFEGDDYKSNESAQILAKRNAMTAVSGHTFSEFDSILVEAIDAQEDLSFPAFNPFSKLRGVKREGFGEVLTMHRRLFRACELKDQLAAGCSFDRSLIEFNEIVLTSKHSDKKSMFADYVRFHQTYLDNENVFFEYVGADDCAIVLRLTDKYENNYRLILVPEEQLENYFIGNPNDNRLTMINEEAPADALRPQITIYTYTDQKGYKEFKNCVPQGATALDFAFIVKPMLALTVKSAKIHTWKGSETAPFTENDYAYPLRTILSDGDVVHFDADYSRDHDHDVNHATIDWFADINTEYAKHCLIKYLR